MRWIVVGLCLAGAACSPTEVCHDGIWLEASPADTTLAVGEAFEPDVRLVRCPDPRAVDASFSTEDAGVVQITNGLITAVGAGEAEVTAAVDGMMTMIVVEVVD